MPPEEKYTLRFVGCKPDRTGNDLTSRVFEPSIQVLARLGYLRNSLYNNRLPPEHLITRELTNEYVENLIDKPRRNTIICAWYDHAFEAGRTLMGVGIPVVYLMLFGVKNLYFKSGNEPDNVIWLSNDWEVSTERFVNQITHCIDNLKT